MQCGKVKERGEGRKNGELFPGLNAVTKSVKFKKISQTIDEVYGVNSRVTMKAPPKFTNITNFTKFTMIGHFRCLVVQ